MAQPIRGMSSIPYAQEVYGGSLEQKGLSGMNPLNQGVANAHDSGGVALPGVNPQESMQLAHSIQNTSNNTDTAQRQANAGARSQMTKESTELSSKQHLLNSKLTDVIYKKLVESGGASSLLALNGVLQGAQGNAFVNDIRTSKGMFG
tara:strand:+ start:321 stop:764 length:444 start_codon:yes stop_codon:yes gene_type:complete